VSVPDFFVVGHPKCGTTALFEMLRVHPQIFMPDCKETFYFADELKIPPARRRPGGPPQTLEEYLPLFAPAAPGQRVGEASALHLWSRSAAGRIAELRPDAKIIGILREPASFLRSLHLQFVQSHVEPEQDFGRALALEESRRAGRDLPRASSHWPLQLLYSDYVRYVEQLRRYEERFPAENILVLIYDDFRRDNEETVRRVLRFLEVEETVPIARAEANPTVRVRSRRLNRLLYEVTMGRGAATATLKRGIKAVTPQRARRRALETVRDRLLFARPDPADEALMAALRERFKPEVAALSEHLERDLVGAWGYEEVSRLD
jgi:hypothetical protein